MEASPVCNTPNGNSLDGLCDMIGNVFEFVLDEYHYNYDGSPNDGSAWCRVSSDCTTNERDTRTTNDIGERIFNTLVTRGSWSELLIDSL